LFLGDEALLDEEVTEPFLGYFSRHLRFVIREMPAVGFMGDSVPENGETTPIPVQIPELFS
jgi:hypothetical protein